MVFIETKKMKERRGGSKEISLVITYIISLTSLYDVKHNEERAKKQWEKRIMNFIINLILLKTVN